MRASRELVEKLKSFEKLETTAYKDCAGIWTIGYGHTRGVKQGQRISETVANNYLAEDMNVVEQVISNLGEWNQNQFDALTCLAYNIGTTALRNSTLLKTIKMKRPEVEIRKKWLEWCHSGGKVVNGLLTRRKWEVDRFFTK